MPIDKIKVDNHRVKDDQGASWIVVKSTTIDRTPLLKSLLADRFPQISFRYIRFNAKNFVPPAKSTPQVDGVIAELKTFQESDLETFDQLYKAYKKANMILILSPKAYQILNKRRKKKLHDHMLVISELKSLDYLAQLPRLIQEVGLRARLKEENKKLQEIMEQKEPGPKSFAEPEPVELPVFSKSVLNSLQERRENKTRDSNGGLRIKLGNWTRTKKKLSEAAQAEVIALFTRSLTRALRSSDRVLRSKENEFIVFLSNVNKKQVDHCTHRIQDTLSSVEIYSTDGKLNLPFKIDAIKDFSASS